VSKLVPIDQLTKHFMQPDSRWLLEKMDKETLAFLEDLKANIKWHKILKESLPLVRSKNKKYEIITGHLRIRTLIELNKEDTFPLPKQADGSICLREGIHFELIEVSDEKSRVLWLVENIHRKELSTSEVFSVVEYYLNFAEGSTTAVATLMKKNRKWVERRKMVLESHLRQDVEKGRMSYWAAYQQLKDTKEKPETKEVFTTTVFKIDYPQFEDVYGSKIWIHGERSDKIYYVASNDESIIKEINHNKSALDPTARKASETIIDETPTSALDALITDLETSPPTREEIRPLNTREEIALERKQSIQGSLSQELFEDEESSQPKDDCPFFGFKIDAPDIRCFNCEKTLEEKCTKKSKENIKNGNIPSNHGKGIEEIGNEIAKLIHTMPHWKKALVMFAQQSYAGGSYDIFKVKLNKHAYNDLKSAWKAFTEASKQYSDDQEVFNRIDRYYQAWNHHRRANIKRLQDALLRVRFPRELNRKQISKLSFDDLLFLQPCKKCFINGTKRNVWQWMPFEQDICSRHRNEKEPAKTRLRSAAIEMYRKIHSKPNRQKGEEFFYRSSNFPPEEFIPLVNLRFPECRAELHKKPQVEGVCNYRIYYPKNDPNYPGNLEAWLEKQNKDNRSMIKDPNYQGPKAEEVSG